MHTAGYTALILFFTYTGSNNVRS